MAFNRMTTNKPHRFVTPEIPEHMQLELFDKVCSSVQPGCVRTPVRSCALARVQDFDDWTDLAETMRIQKTSNCFHALVRIVHEQLSELAGPSAFVCTHVHTKARSTCMHACLPARAYESA